MSEVRQDLKLLLSEQQRENLYRWLSPPEPLINHNKARRQHYEGTGSWFLQSESFRIWNSQRNSFLWLYGKPGCGKTVISSTIIRHLERLSIGPLLYFYFDFANAEKQTLRGAVCSLITQLYHTCEGAREPLDTLFSSSDHKRTRPSCELLCKIFKDMTERAERVWIVLDAVDECVERKGGPVEGLLSWIQDFVVWEPKNVHFLITSRPADDIQSGLDDLISEKTKISLQSSLVDNDILAYIRAKVREGEGLKRWRGHRDVQQEIEVELVQKADGM